jgi:putative PIN family toxin of toxin-antitoxin system
LKIVLDTNVLISGMLDPRGAPGRIVDLLRSAALTLVVDDRILAEYGEVLERKRFERYFSRSTRQDVMEFLRGESHCIACSVVVETLPDRGDIPFLETALTEQVPLITGNTKHFPPKLRRGCVVLSPGELLRRHLREPS